VPIHADALDAHIKQHGPFLFHVTEAACRGSILGAGLCAGSDLGHFVRDDFFRTRPKHVYIGDRRRVVPVVPVDGQRLTVQVDLRLLDPARFDTDEDVPYNQQRFQGNPWFDAKPPAREMIDSDTEAPGQAGLLAAWAESIPEFDEPPFAARSLAAGRVAYRGTIAPAALKAIELQSEVVDTFAAHASQLLKVNDLGRVPVLGFCDVEARRALVIAQLVLDAGLSTLSEPPLTSDTDLWKPTMAYYLKHRIRHFGFQHNRAGNWDSRDLAFALADLATAVGQFDCTLGWDPDACVAISIGAAAALPPFATMAGDKAAVSLARRAVANSG
jgi:hypothetical protein